MLYIFKFLQIIPSTLKPLIQIMKTHRFFPRSPLAVALAVAISLTSAISADYTWGFNAAGNWNDSSGSAGWNAAGAYPNAIGDVANLTFNITAARIVTINVANATVGSLNIADTGSTFFGWTVATSDAVNNLLTFQTSSGNALLTSAGATNTISAPVVLSSNLDISASSNLAISGPITGAGSITKSGTGVVTISNSILSGKTLSVTEGTLAVSGVGSSFTNLQFFVGATSGTNNVTLNLNSASSTSMNNTNTITIVSGNSGTAFLQQGAGGGSASVSANVVLGSGGTGKGVTLINPGISGNTSANILGVFSDPAGLTGAGGVVTIAAIGPQAMRFGNVASSYTGGTVIESGILQLYNGSGSFFGTGPVTVNGGSFRNNANGTSTLTGASSMILNADLNFVGNGANSNNFAVPINLGATGTATSRIINMTNTSGSGNLTISGVISDGSNGFTKGITKTGLSTATLTLGGANNYTGLTTISSGTLALALNGSINTSSGVDLGTLASQGTLLLTAKPSFGFGTSQTVSGYGTINIGAGKTVTVSGVLSPGNSPGQITVTGNLALEGTTATMMELAGLGGVKGTDFDNVTTTGSLAYDGDLSIISFGGFNLYQTATYSLFDFSSQSGNFDSILFGGNALSFSSGIWSGDNGSFSYSFELATGDLTVAAIPEPATWALLAISLTTVMVLRRRRS